MRWRIIQRVDGKYEIERKNFWFSRWENRCGSFYSLESAKDTMNDIINNRTNEINSKKGKKFLKIIEESGEY